MGLLGSNYLHKERSVRAAPVLAAVLLAACGAGSATDESPNQSFRSSWPDAAYIDITNSMASRDLPPMFTFSKTTHTASFDVVRRRGPRLRLRPLDGARLKSTEPPVASVMRAPTGNARETEA
jgi:hypothetical protein